MADQIISEDLAQKAVAAIQLSLRDLENMKQLFRSDVDNVTITDLDGKAITGPTLIKILDLAGKSDISAMGAVGSEILRNRTAAEAAQKAAEAARTTVATSASNAKTSEDNAQTSENNASDSAKAAKASEDAALTSEDNASDYADAAALSEANALTYRNNAAGSETTARNAATAAGTSAGAAATSAAAALVSQNAAKASENAAANSASDIAAAEKQCEDARDLAQQYAEAANTSRQEASGFRDGAQTAEANAKMYAENARAAVDDVLDANKFVNAVDVNDQDVVDFKQPPTVNGTPIVANLVQGGFHVNADETCGESDDLNDANWQGKTFMVQKPTLTGTAANPIASNNAPAQMVYKFAVCTDFYAGWTPAGGAMGDQRVQIIYDEESIWIRGFHVESQQWTTWKRIVTQLKTDVTGKDLDTLILTGHYTYTSALHAPIIDASEASPIYFLDIFSTDNGDDVYQVMHAPKTNSRFDRYRINGTWSRWWNSTATFDVDTMAPGKDLNEVTNPGWWGVPLDTAKNLPTGTDYPPSKTGQGMLEVIGISNGATIQRLHYGDDGDVYYRFRTANSGVNGTTPGVWQPWQVELHLPESRVVPVVNGGTGVKSIADLKNALGLGGYAALDQTIRYMGSIPAGTDLNSYDTADNGWYTQQMSSGATIALNYPEPTAGYLFHIARGINQSDAYQIYYPFITPGKFYQRIKNGANWGGWVSFTSDNIVKDSAVVVKTSDANANKASVIQARYRSDGDDNCYIGVMKPDGNIGGVGDLGQIRMGGNRATGTVQIDAAYQGSIRWNGLTAKAGGSDQSAWSATVEASGTNAAGTMSIVMGRDHSIRYNAAIGGAHFFNNSIRASGDLQAGDQTYQAATAAGVTPAYKAGYRGAKAVRAAYWVAYPDGISSTGIYVRNPKNDAYETTVLYDNNGQWSINGYLQTSTNPAKLASLRINNAGGSPIQMVVPGTGANVLEGHITPDPTKAPGTKTRAWYVGRGSAGNNRLHLWNDLAAGGATSVTLNEDRSIVLACAKAQVNGSVITVSSDRRLKTNIRSIPNALAKIDAIDGVTYTYIKDSIRSAGFIAQDVQSVLPDAVDEYAGDENTDKHLHLNYNGVSALMLNAIKELKAEVLSLKAELAELKSK